jgi:putative two-component system response regulator
MVNTMHIITTDDDPAIRKILRIILSKAGYQVTLCTHGQELLDTLSLHAEHVDALLLDIRMPGLSGFEVLSILKKTYPSIPVIMLTAFSDLETGMKAIRLGAADYLPKPVHQSELIECVQRVITTARLEQRKAEAFSINNEYQKKLEHQLNTAYTTIMQTTMATIEAFSETIEQKDPYTKGHCHRVRHLSRRIGECLHLSAQQCSTLEAGSLLHDIGKISIPESILNKQGKLTAEEFSLIQTHPEAGTRIIGHIDLFKPYLDIVRSHHERFDGSGYPDGLKGEDIPKLARIVSVADAFDAMTSSRSYRSALPKELAVEEMKLYAGSQFDPAIVDIFIDNEIYDL